VDLSRATAGLKVARRPTNASDTRTFRIVHFFVMSIRSTDTTLALSDDSTVYPVDQFGTDELSVESYVAGSYVVAFDFTVHALMFLTLLFTSYKVRLMLSTTLP
jgi:hypothetical protein